MCFFTRQAPDVFAFLERVNQDTGLLDRSSPALHARIACEVLI